MSEKIKEILKKAEELESSGKIMDAIKKYEEAIELSPENLEAHFKLGLLCMKILQKDIEVESLLENRADDESWALRAVGEFKRVLDIDPNYEPARKNIEIIEEVLKHGRY